MSTAAKVGTFVAGLAVLFAGAFGVGRLFEDEPQRYTLVARVEPDDGMSLTIRDGAGDTVRGYQTRHEKLLHLIAVRKDFGDYRHLHPELDNSGTWYLDEDLRPGQWRLYADFQPTGGEATVAYDDVTIAGEPAPAGSGALTDAAEVDGYRVAVAERDGSLAFTVERDGRPVTDLETYLGAYGHLVVIRESDLEFLHVHPDDGPAGPQILFGVAGATPDRYRAYFEFQHRGAVRTVPFVLDLGAANDEQEGGSHGDH